MLFNSSSTNMKIQLDRTQKIAFSRIISDLIEADFIVEEGEMEFYENIVKENNISESMLIEAKKMDLAKSVAYLKEMDDNRREQVIACLKELALSDGTCVPLEAIQIFALEQAMEHDACMYSVPSKDIGIENMKVIYIENEKNTNISKCIEDYYRTISNEFAFAGFDFVYIPFVVSDYKRMDLSYLKKVVKYMIPSAPEEKIVSICNDLQSMTTDKFCRDLLYKKINIPLIDTKPSLLIKINESALIDQYDPDDAERINFANFLRIELQGDVLREIRNLIDSYHRMINCTITVNSMPKNQKFMYYGFHRSLFDLIAYGREQKEYNLFFDLTGFQAKVYFEPIDGSSERIPIKLNPHEVALYVMIVKKSLTGKGLYWREDENKQKRETLAEYNQVYKRLSYGKQTGDYVDRSRIHHIRNRIRCIQCIANMELFIPHNIKDGINSFYMVKATPKSIQIKE